MNTIYIDAYYFSCKNIVLYGPTGIKLGPTGNSPRNTPHFVQLIITWTSQKSNGPSDLVQGIH